jgi:hypothetical protein
VKKLVLLASILASWAANARASELQSSVSKLPFYEVEARCNGISRSAGSRSAYAECIYREQFAYDAIKPMWASLPAATQVQCDQVARAEGGIGSYATLNACATQGNIPQQDFAKAVVVGPASAPRIVAPTVETSVWKGEFGGRYWYSSGRTQYGLYGLPPELAPTNLVSRLTYTGLTGHTGELFGRVDHWSGVFVKGNVGLGSITNGNLQDEDFPPFFPPFLPQVYSSTNSEQRSGHLGYLTADVGWAFWQPLSATSSVKAGPFFGYFHYDETLNAFGCTQTAGNPVICAPSIPTSVASITQKTQWNAVRVGLNGVWKVDERLKLTGEAAWLIPFASLTASDAHLLRIGTDFNGPTPIDGHGYGVQLEGILSYNVTAAFSVGVGARYWLIQTRNADATAHFEQSSTLTGFGPQAMTVKTERYGGFVQASYNFGAPQGP